MVSVVINSFFSDTCFTNDILQVHVFLHIERTPGLNLD